jgi:hypothetical protein
MIKIIFKNGHEQKISYAIFDIINKKICSESGANNFETFSDENGIVFLAINMQEVLCIVDEKHKYLK